VRLSAVGLLEVIAVIFLISMTLTLLGFAVAWQMDSTHGFHAIINLALVPMWMVSGSLFTMGSAHGWIKVLMTINPLTYAVAALRRLLEPNVAPGTPGMTVSLLVTAGCGTALLILSAVVAGRKGGRSSA